MIELHSFKVGCLTNGRWFFCRDGKPAANAGILNMWVKFLSIFPEEPMMQENAEALLSAIDPLDLGVADKKFNQVNISSFTNINWDYSGILLTQIIFVLLDSFVVM